MWNDPTFIKTLREDTPGTANYLHFNNAGAALMPRQVLSAIQIHLEIEAASGGYEAADMAHERIEAFYSETARLINAAPRNIAFTSSATDAYNRALSSISFVEGDVILTTRDDYVSNQIAFLQLQRRLNVRLIRVPNTLSGETDVEALEKMIDQYVPRLVAVTHVPTSSGLVQPVEAIGAICMDKGIWYLVDACQSTGQMPVDVERIQCDFLSATFRKFLRGPRGAGFLYVSDRVLSQGLAPLFLDLHGAEWKAPGYYEPVATARRFEQWERPYALVCGAMVCVEYALELGLQNIGRRVRKLADHCRGQLAEIPGVRVLDKGTELCGIITISAERSTARALKEALAKRKINTSIVDKSSALLDFTEKKIENALRISPHYYNTEEEISLLTGALSEILRES